MINAPIFATNLERIAAEDLRYLFYLSRNNAWVVVENDLFQFEIKKVENNSELDNQSAPFSRAEESKLKLKLSKLALSAHAFSMGSHATQFAALGHKTLPDMDFKVISKHFEEFCIFLTTRRSISLHAEARNFDCDYLSKLSEQSDKEQYVSEYKKIREKALENSIKNAVWLAAMSGDSQQLNYLLNCFPDFDVNAVYKDKNILQAMFDADLKAHLPFKNEVSDYKTTIDLLVKSGLAYKEMNDMQLKYKSYQNNLPYFKNINSHQTQLLSIIKECMDGFYESEGCVLL